MDRSQSVFHLFHSTAVGGIETHVLQLATAQREFGWKPRIVTREDGWLAKRAAADGFEVLPLRMRGFYDLRSAIRLATLVRGLRPDLLHAHGMRGSRYARIACRLCRSSALVMTAHSTNSWKHFDSQGAVICVSRAVKTALAERGLTNLHLIRNGIPDDPPESPASIGVAPSYLDLSGPRTNGGLLLLHVGRFIPDKAQDWLLTQLERLPDELSERLSVLFVGDWQRTDYGRTCHNRSVASPRLRERTLFVGEQGKDAISALYGLADAVVLPSRREACPLTLLEAARAGLPVLASAVGGVPELVQESETGYLFPPGNGAVFARKLGRLLDPDQRRTIGAASRDRFLRHFTARRMAVETLALYRNLLDVNEQRDRNDQSCS